jgi:hypothetical protein
MLPMPLQCHWRDSAAAQTPERSTAVLMKPDSDER